MIVLFTDFGRSGPYQGLLQNAIYKIVPETTVIDLMADAPAYDAESAGYLLAALSKDFVPGTVFLGVVDPGVGGSRKPCIVLANGHWFVGPDNGLFDVVASQDESARWWCITWQPESLSHTFHGRDLFAPVAAYLAQDVSSVSRLAESEYSKSLSVPVNAYRIIYIDDYGNLFTGIQAASISSDSVLELQGISISHAQIFSDVGLGQAFWFENAFGLIEIAVNSASAAKHFGVEIGTVVNETSTISS